MSDEQDRSEQFVSIYNRYWKQVLRFSRLYIHDPHVQEEIVQEVFIRLWEYDRLDLSKNIEGFLFITTRNTVFNRFRSKVNYESYTQAIINSFEYSAQIEENIEANELRQRIDMLVEEMPPRRRRIFTMSRKRLMSHREIASELNMSEKAVERQIGEALSFLKKNLILMAVFISLS